MASKKDPLIADAALLQQAEQVCKRRLEQEPENRAVLRSLAEVCRKLGKLDEAAAAYGRLFQLDPNDQEAGYTQAVLGGKPRPRAPEGCRPAPFVLLRNFFPPEFHGALLPFMVSVRDRFVPAPCGNMGYQPGHCSALDYSDKWEGMQRVRNRLTKVLPDAISRLYLPSSRTGSIEVTVRAYRDGHFFVVHQDVGRDGMSAKRVLNFVYYFHRSPRPYTGGELLLFDSDVEAGTYTAARYTRVVPEDNSVIIFPSNFYHTVVPICCPSTDFADSRFVIVGHVHKVEEKVPSVPGAVANAQVPAPT